MRVTSFTCAKDPARPEANEDRLVLIGDDTFAVIDGVTDKSGKPLPDGSSRGQLAGRLIAEQLADSTARGELATCTAAALLGRFEAAIQAAYRRLGIESEARVDPMLRCGAQFAGAFRLGQRWRLVVVGDCGVRLNGQRRLGRANPGDVVVSFWRAAVVRELLAAGASEERALEIGRLYAVHGSGQFQAAAAADLPLAGFERLRRRTIKEATRHLIDVPPAALAAALEEGLVGLGRLRNRAGPLGFPCIDGFPVPDDAIIEEWVGEDELEVLELFSDGYFGTPPHGETGIAAWEEHFARVERDDPLKIGAYASTKGSGPGRFTDDRSVLVLDFTRGAPGTARAMEDESSGG